jgi:hypothetical protein
MGIPIPARGPHGPLEFTAADERVLAFARETRTRLLTLEENWPCFKRSSGRR